MTPQATPPPFGQLVAEFLGTALPEHLAAAVPLPELPPDARDFIRRMLTLMKRAAYPTTEFNTILVQVLATMVPNMLPCAWGGRIPPITHQDRHRKLDAYVAGENLPGDAPRLFVDLGCGFPPVTTADTAKRFPTWRVMGVDRSFARYVVTDSEGHYACFDAGGGFQYYQAMMTHGGRAMYQHPAAARKHFQALFDDLRPLLSEPGDAASETVTKNGCRLVRDHIRDFETDNLTFSESEIEGLDLPPVDVIRCMNVLVYVAGDARGRLQERIGAHLRDGGILITGTNGPGIYSRYAVHEKGPEGLKPKEFAFSLENLRPFGVMPWFTIHDNDPEAMLLATLNGAIRADRSFWPDFDHRVDALLARHEVCRRENHGYLSFPEEMPPVSELMAKMAAIWKQMIEEGYLDGAVEALRRAGHDALENQAGDIAIRPVRHL
ncbi:MAG: hypothetical protein ABIL58_24315 [Pseudomonadota bacterium]